MRLPEPIDLIALEDVIYGRGQWHVFGQGLTSHPAGDDKAVRLHEACVELERQGRIKRHYEYTQTGSVAWKPAVLADLQKGDK